MTVYFLALLLVSYEASVMDDGFVSLSDEDAEKSFEHLAGRSLGLGTVHATTQHRLDAIDIISSDI